MASIPHNPPALTKTSRTPQLPEGKGRYLRLAGKRHAEDGDAAEDALPAGVANSLQPLPAEEAVLEGRQHNLQPKERKKGLRSSPRLTENASAGVKGSTWQLTENSSRCRPQPEL